ncbi:metallophosphoesterase [Candidatus Chloroploca sp. M-50]|uniref:Metallophosphoesterase n=1 Tax=Candidatus Chloroploca mongolica TaxID=2528176 RepID=A0ABS4DA94_9CHLR|nr:metallophosphoesterase [Candidatus Chloroploca mongolica]MBP1466369.1 metallophosphoesterase [Candidatus Chloroploca mongolica]
MIWTISDLHLSHAHPKPMDIFGAHWRDHATRIATAWRARVAPDDWVLIAGDISWALKLADALVDLRWIDTLPGRKVLIRGNHDYWCPRKVGSMRRHMPPSLNLIGADAFDLGSAVACGTRGWVTPEMPGYDAVTDEPIYRRELGMLDRAIAQGQQLAANKRPLIIMLHYPPFVNQQPTEFAHRIAASGASACIYGHLHRVHDHQNAINHTIDGVAYQLTSADFIGFGPVAVRGLNSL